MTKPGSIDGVGEPDIAAIICGGADTGGCTNMEPTGGRRGDVCSIMPAAD